MSKEKLAATIVLCWLVGHAFARQAPLEGALGAGVKALPHPAYMNLFTDDEREALDRLLSISDEQLDILLNSDDPRKIGLRIHVVDARGDLRRLLELAPLLEDDRATVPMMALIQPEPSSILLTPPNKGDYNTYQTTVAKFLAGEYALWFGRSIVIHTPEQEEVLRGRFGPSMGGYGAMGQFERTLGKVEDPELMVHPWIRRLRRAASYGTPKQLEAVKEQVQRLPPELRWAVLASAHTEFRFAGASSGYTKNELVDEFRRLPPALRQAPAEQLAASTDPTLTKEWLDEMRRGFIEFRAMAEQPERAP